MNIYKSQKIQKKNDYNLSSYAYIQPLYLLSLGIAFIYIYYTIQAFRDDKALIISLSLFLLWLSVSFLANPMTYVNYMLKKKYILLAMFFAYYFVGGIISGLDLLGSAKLVFGYVVIISPMLIYDFYSINNKLKSLVFLSISLIGMYFILNIKTLYVLFTVPNAARALASGSLHDKTLGALNDIGIGGGYDLTYALCVLIPFLIVFIKGKTIMNIYIKSLIYIFIILSVYTIIKSDYGMGFLLSLISILLALFVINGNFKRDLTLMFVIFVTSLFLMTFLLNPLTDLIIYISFFFEDSFIGQRLQELAFGLKGSDFGSSTEYRFQLYARSFETFLESPFVGVGYLVQYDYYAALQYVGGHSEWLDFLANFGLFGALPLFLVFYLNFIEVMNKYRGTKYQSPILISYSLFIIIGSINLVFKFGIMVAILLFIPTFPIFVEMIKRKKHQMVKGD